MKNNILSYDELNQKIIEATNSSRKNEFAKFMKKNNISYDVKIIFNNQEKYYNFSLLFQCTLFMLNKYYLNKGAKNAVTLLDIIERDDFNPYTSSIKNIPDFLLTYLFLFLSRKGHLRRKFNGHNLKNGTNLNLVDEDFKYYFKEYYKEDYNHFYTDIHILACELYKIQHPLLSQEKMECFLADISVAFIMDRANILSSSTVNPKTNTDKIEPKKLRDIAYLPFISYDYCSKYIGNIIYPLKSILHNYEYFNIKTVLTYSDFIFENNPVKKYNYCREAMKLFLTYYQKVSLSTEKIVIGDDDTNMAIFLAKHTIECLSQFQSFTHFNIDEEIILSFLNKTQDKYIIHNGKSLLMKFRLQKILNNEENKNMPKKTRL